MTIDNCVGMCGGTDDHYDRTITFQVCLRLCPLLPR